MITFKTDRLDIKEMNEEDLEFFIELLSSPTIIDPIPQPQWTEKEILDKFKSFIDYPDEPKNEENVVWGVYEKGKNELIGICALMTNDEKQKDCIQI